jgi:hypothetical protein
LVVTSTAVLPAGSAVEARQSERPCLFASRALRLRAPSLSAASRSEADTPGPPEHLGSLRGVRRYRRIASRLRFGAPAGCGRRRLDSGGGREVGHFPWLALGRLSFGDHVTGVSVARLSDGHRAARGPWCSRCTSLRLLVVPALEVPGTISKPKGAPRKYQDGPSSCAGCAPGRMGIAWTPVRQGVGIIAAWFAPGCGSIGKQPAAIRAGTCFTAEPAKLQRE